MSHPFPAPLTPISMTRAEAVAATALFRVFQAGGPLRIALADQTFELDLLPRPRPCQPRLDVHLELDAGQEELLVNVGLEQDIATDALAEFMTPEDETELPLEIRIALVEAVCEEALVGLSALLGRPLRLAGLQEEPVDPHAGYPCLGFVLTRLNDGRRTLGLARIRDKENVAQLFDLLAWAVKSAPDRVRQEDASEMKQSLNSALDDLPVTLRPTIGRTRITMGELQGLEVNDLVLVQEFYGEQSRRFHLGPKMALVVGIHGRQATITTILTETDMQIETGPEPGPLDDKTQAAEPGSSQDTAKLDLDGLDIELAFELGRETMTLGELKQLAPGQVFELMGPTSGPVMVTANGRPVARGELVDIEGRAGVRILELLAGPRTESDVREST